jgi:hypothetical protein
VPQQCGFGMPEALVSALKKVQPSSGRQGGLRERVFERPPP